MNEIDPASERTTLHRYAHRAAYDRATVDAILDEGFVCHVGMKTSEGYPVVIPLAYGRDGDVVYLHGSAASRLFRGARSVECEICMTVTFVDGLVVARSTYNTDINYRSVVIIGPASEVKDLDQKRAGLDLLVEHIIPGRSRDARPPTEKELRSTMLLRLPLGECSAKVRSGWPLDEEEDYDLPIWAGVIPLTTVTEPPVVDPLLRVDAAMPDYVARYRRPSRAMATASSTATNGVAG
jgi:nitroimidazol reductase NimA-like FMN-containing flavoprotein (pyridoxamine 5'-phosphate oxidase superfamily)